jgi:hypothetical protein
MLKFVNLAAFALFAGVGAVSGAAEPAALAGTWQIRIASPQGVRTPTMAIAQDGVRLTGTYSSMKNGDAPLAGTVDGQQFVVKVRVSSGDRHLEMEYKGRFDGQTLAGVVVMGSRGEAPFTATRVP